MFFPCRSLFFFHNLSSSPGSHMSSVSTSFNSYLSSQSSHFFFVNPFCLIVLPFFCFLIIVRLSCLLAFCSLHLLFIFPILMFFPLSVPFSHADLAPFSHNLSPPLSCSPISYSFSSSIPSLSPLYAPPSHLQNHHSLSLIFRLPHCILKPLHHASFFHP